MNLIEQIMNEIPEDAADAKIEETANVLEGKYFEPMLLISTPGFIRMKREDIGRELNRVLGLKAPEVSDEMKSRHIELLLYYYDLLCGLRLDQAAAWDTINELYEDD